MKTKIKLDLKALKIKSFVTEFQQEKIKGGMATPLCATRVSVEHECDGTFCDCG